MKSLEETLKESLGVKQDDNQDTPHTDVNERRGWKSLQDILEEHITQGLKDAWDDEGIEFTHKEVKDTLEKIAKEYDIDKHIDWAKNIIK